MSENRFFDRLRNGETLLGLGWNYPSPGSIEGMCKGWDFVWIDGQHGQLAYGDCLGGVHAAGALGIETILRVPGHEPGIIGPYLDLAPSALMVPMVNNAEEARRVVRAAHFPPRGERSYGGRRVIDLYGREYVRERETMVVAQIETLEAVDNAQAIIETEGIDMLFFGPDDAKVRLDLPMNTSMYDNERLFDAMKRTAAAARKAGKPCGTVGADAKSAASARELGYTLLVGGSDIAMLRTTSARILGELQGALKESLGKGKEGGSSDSTPGVY